MQQMFVTFSGQPSVAKATNKVCNHSQTDNRQFNHKHFIIEDRTQLTASGYDQGNWVT